MHHFSENDPTIDNKTPHSRVHMLKTVANCYIKREDELGCLISGPKVRKYRSQIAAIKKQGHKKAALIGSQFSNHVLGLSSLLIENDIEPILFLLKSSQEHPQEGNWLFTKLFVPQENIRFLSRSDWPIAMEIASKECPYVVPEGGSIEDSVEGLSSLAYDILQNEQEIQKEFKSILIDSGSGLTAATLIATLGKLQKKATVHVMLASDSDAHFLKVLEHVQQLLGGYSLVPFHLHRPPTAKAFGSTNATIFNTIAHVARTEGFLLDPLYSCKLFLLLQQLTLEGPILFIHSGGLFSLSGFQPQLNTVTYTS